MPLAENAQLKAGDEIAAIGYETGLDAFSTFGTITDLQATHNSIPMVAVSAAVHYDNIGGPLITATGHVAGVNAFTPDDNPEQGLALSVASLRETLELYNPIKGTVAIRCPECRSLLVANETGNPDECPHCNAPVIFPSEVMEDDLSKPGVYEVMGKLVRGMWLNETDVKRGMDNWEIPVGCATTYIEYDYHKSGFVYAKGFLGRLPADPEKAAAVYQFLLEENEHQTPNSFLCVENRIYLANIRFMGEFYYGYIQPAYSALFRDADRYKALLKEKFDCTE